MHEIFAYGNNDALYGIFNVMAAIMGSNSYLAALAAVAVIGFMAAILAYAFAPEKLIGWKWLASVILVYAILFVPKVTIGIVDKLGAQPVQVVANVPFGAGVFGHLTSVIGNVLTELFEMGFQAVPGAGELPADLTYQRHGVMFGARLIRETRGLVFRDPEFRTDLVNYIGNCTIYDLADGTISPTDFSRSTDLWPLMANPNPARFSTVTADGVVDSRPCPQVYASLAARMPAQLDDLQLSLATLLNPNLPGPIAQAEIANQVWAAYTKAALQGAAASAAEIIRQNALINAVSDSSHIIGQRLNDPSSQILAIGRAQATAQINASWINFGRVAQEALPLIRNSLEGVIYALFPFVILLLFFTYGQGTLLALKSYLIVLIWIQMWPPAYAILNYFALLANAKSLAAAANMGPTSGLSLLTHSPVYQNAISAEAVVGYLLMVALPAIAWAVVKGIDTLGQAHITGVGSLQGTLAGASSMAAAGNLGLGNVSMDQVALAPTRTSAFMSRWQHDVTGHTFQENVLSGRKAVSLLQNEGFASLRTGGSRESAVAEQMTKGIESARNDGISAANERSAALAESVSKGVDTTSSRQSATSYLQGESSQARENYGAVRQMVQQYAREIDKGEAVAARLLFNAAANVGGGLTGGSSNRGGVGVGLDGGVSVGGSLNQNYSSDLTRKYGELLQTMTSEQASKLNEYAERFSRDREFRTAVIGSERDAEDFSARIQTAKVRTERAEAVLKQLTSYAETARFSQASEEQASLDILKDPRNWQRLTEIAERYDGSPSMARVAIDNLLAETSVLGRPTRGLSGAALAWGSDPVSARHASDRDHKDLDVRVDAVYASMKGTVGAKPGRAAALEDVTREADARIGNQRSEAERAHGALTEEQQEAAKRFQTVTGMTSTAPEQDDKGVGNPDGSLRTKRILGNDVKDLFLEDAKQSLQNAAEGVRGLFGKDPEAERRSIEQRTSSGKIGPPRSGKE